MPSMTKHRSGPAARTQTSNAVQPPQPRDTSAEEPDSTAISLRQGSSEKFGQWAAVVGVALTLVGVLGYGAGRTYVRTYWNSHGVSSQFSQSGQDTIYVGLQTNLELVFWFALIALCSGLLLQLVRS